MALVETRQYDALNRVITVSGLGSPCLTTATRYDHDGNVYHVVHHPAGDAVVTTYDSADEPDFREQRA
jgi:hypothetical protein